MMQVHAANSAHARLTPLAAGHSAPRQIDAGNGGQKVTSSGGNELAAKARKVAAVEAAERAQLAQIRALKNRDREVRQHERAHASAAAGVPHSAPSYTYTRGPDGQMYATGGEVRIDTSPVPNDPSATLRKAQQIQRAALAPAQPSATDRAVAAQAAAMAAAARADEASDRAENTAEHVTTENVTEERDDASLDTPALLSTHASDEGPMESTTCAICGAAHSAGSHVEATYAVGQSNSGEHATGNSISIRG